MTGQITDKRTVGIPPDIVRVRHETEQFMIEAGTRALESEQQANASAASANQSAVHAEEAQSYAAQAKEWSELQTQGVHFGPAEPDYETRYDGQLWLKTDEEAATITNIRRWDADQDGQGLFPSEGTYPSETLYPQDKGAWKDFSLNLS